MAGKSFKRPGMNSQSILLINFYFDFHFTCNKTNKNKSFFFFSCWSDVEFLQRKFSNKTWEILCGIQRKYRTLTLISLLLLAYPWANQEFNYVKTSPLQKNFFIRYHVLSFSSFYYSLNILQNPDFVYCENKEMPFTCCHFDIWFPH